nr:hypothetical protein [Salinispora fenicalii]
MTGLALTTTVGLTATPAAEAVGPAPTSADRQHDEGKNDNKGKEKTPEGTPVPCDTDALIAAITLANARGGAVLDLAKNCTYLLTADIDGTGLPTITTPITLNGNKHTTIERAAAADPFRILTVNTGGDLTLNKLKITGGQSRPGFSGGGILVNPGGELTTKHSEIVRNIATFSNGGGVSNLGTTTIKDSTVSRNAAAQAGGINNTGLLNIKRSAITHNTATSLGGGLLSRNGTVDISESTIAANQAETGGLLLIDGTSTVTDTHITKNTARLVGGVGVSAGQHTLRKVTIDYNTATADGGGVFVDVGTPLVIDDSIIANNTSDSNGGGIENVGETVLRRTKIVNNRAGNNGGGIFNQTFGTLTLYATKVVKNTAANNGGGIFNQAGVVELNTATGTVVIKNRPNNCVDVPGCAG